MGFSTTIKCCQEPFSPFRYYCFAYVAAGAFRGYLTKNHINPIIPTAIIPKYIYPKTSSNADGFKMPCCILTIIAANSNIVMITTIAR